MPARKELEFRNEKPRATPFKMSDGGGLFLLVQPGGSKLWRLAYRFGGRQKLLALGSYPLISLADARAARDNAKKQIAEGIDPSEARKSEKRARKISHANTFEAVAKECLVKWEAEGASPRTLKKKSWLLNFAIRELGKRPIAEVKAGELLDSLRKVEKRGRYETALRIRSVVGEVLRFAVATSRAERDITVDIRNALVTPQVAHHAAITEPRKIGALLRAIDGFDGHYSTCAALRLAPLVFVRPGELRLAEWSEIDLESGTWRIPGKRMKMRQDHIVPLSRQAVSILTDLKDITGTSNLLFPSTRSWQRPISENTLNAALRRLGYAKDEMTTHGFRSMASTRLNESGKFSPDAIERQLAHQEKSEVRRAYNAAQYLPERTKMMQEWANYLDNLREEKPTG